MRRTYVTNVEDKAGSFLRAAKVISANGGNIVRTSYNKSVDSNTMFLDVSADDDSVFEILNFVPQSFSRVLSLKDMFMSL